MEKVERTFSWMKGCRRLAKDYDKKVETSESFIEIFGVHILLQKIQMFNQKHPYG